MAAQQQQQSNLTDWPTRETGESDDTAPVSTDCHHLDEYAVDTGNGVVCVRCDGADTGRQELDARRDQLADQGASNFGGLD